MVCGCAYKVILKVLPLGGHENGNQTAHRNVPEPERLGHGKTAHRPTKTTYIKRFVALIDQIQESSLTLKIIAKVTPAFPFEAYSHVVSPIDAAVGGGFMFTIPDIPGVLADGATELDAIAGGREAFIATVSAMVDMVIRGCDTAVRELRHDCQMSEKHAYF